MVYPAHENGETSSEPTMPVERVIDPASVPGERELEEAQRKAQEIVEVECDEVALDRD